MGPARSNTAEVSVQAVQAVPARPNSGSHVLLRVAGLPGHLGWDTTGPIKS